MRLPGLWRRSTVNVHPNKCLCTRSAWTMRQRSWRESIILTLLVREDCLFFQIRITTDASPFPLVSLTWCFLVLTTRFPCLHHGQRRFQVFGHGVRRRTVPQRHDREEERGRPESFSCSRRRKGGAARGSWSAGKFYNKVSTKTELYNFHGDSNMVTLHLFDLHVV